MPTAAELRQCPLSCFPFFGPVRSVSGGRDKKRLIYEAKTSSTRVQSLPREEWHFVARSAIWHSNLFIYQPFVLNKVPRGNCMIDAEWHSGRFCAAPQSGTKCHTWNCAPQARCLDRAKGNRGPVRAPGHEWRYVFPGRTRRACHGRGRASASPGRPVRGRAPGICPQGPGEPPSGPRGSFCTGPVSGPDGVPQDAPVHVLYKGPRTWLRVPEPLFL